MPLYDAMLMFQMTASKDFVVHLVATPALSGEGNGDVEPQCKRWLSVDAVDEQYVVNHARQVNCQVVFKSHSHTVDARCNLLLVHNVCAVL